MTLSHIQANLSVYYLFILWTVTLRHEIIVAVKSHGVHIGVHAKIIERRELDLMTRGMSSPKDIKIRVRSDVWSPLPQKDESNLSTSFFSCFLHNAYTRGEMESSSPQRDLLNGQTYLTSDFQRDKK